MPVFTQKARLRLTRQEMLDMADRCSRNGIGTSTYNYEPDVGEVNVLFTTSHLAGITHTSEKDDTINEQLADLNRLVCQDAVKVKNMPNKMQTFETFLDNPNLDGENDRFRKNMERKKWQVRVPQVVLKEINDQFEREGKRAMNDIKGEINCPDGKREFIFDYGQVESG